MLFNVELVNCLEWLNINRKKKKQVKDKIDLGLLIYPTLTAADILLYDASIVPVGKDQKQHIEITRDFGDRFNKRYGHTFNLPKYYIPEIGGKIMNLQNPSEKMSKSAPPSSNQIYFDEVNKPGISNLISIFSAITDKSIKEIENKYKNYNYGDFKNELANEIEKLIIPIQEKYKKYRYSKELINILKTGAKEASKIASKKIIEVRKKFGIKYDD